MPPLLVSVAIPCPLRRRFDYLWPDSLGRVIEAGLRVRVPFGRREVVGVVIAPAEGAAVDASRLKAVSEVLDERPSLSPPLLSLGLWAADYYHHPVGECLQQMLPVALRKAATPARAKAERWQLCAGVDVSTLPPQAKQQRALCEAFREHGVLSREALGELGFSRATLRELEKKALVEEAATTAAVGGGVQGPPLNDEQQQALVAITDALGQFRRFLLDGITGSGKTEVYLRGIEQCLQQGRQCLVLVPEIGLTPQTLRRFERRFPGRVTSLHSGLADSERLRNWQAARDGHCDIVLGTRSAVFADLPRLGLIIVDEEHDASYKQQDGWRYSARDIAVKRAADQGCPIVLGSATPSLDSLHNGDQGRYHLLRLRQRAGEASEAAIRLVDIRQQPLQDGLSAALLTAVDATLAAGNQVLLFLNRRGFAPVLQCHHCGWIAECAACDARMTVHYKRRQLRCHHCEAVRGMPRTCPDCDNAEWLYEGPGTERLEMNLQKRFRERVLRIDRDSTSAKGSMAALVAEVRQGEPCILVGTQMLAKGHHFPKVTLVGVLDMDAGLFSADYRATESSAQLLLQVAGRAGRAEQAGEVLLQTHCPQHPALQTLVHRGYRQFASTLLAERRLLGLPPFSYCAVIRADAVTLSEAEDFLATLRSALAEPANDWHMVGPLPAPMARRAGRFRASLILQADTRGRLHGQLQRACAVAEGQRAGQRLRWSIDVDPIDLF
ncbi:primosomal protein N' [Spongiibacter sp. KMU-166]|uniref:Replication restart protein PriA n=1 Tax=Spongiibacter thalassae TaxID=2721624 RepID=A0ABX1GIX4_9GAMM|nr:primosomal protein N' [Spongiibacter thalassae]NKI18397.1 primosomal protein N' [Spongiibacter thalassae]